MNSMEIVEEYIDVEKAKASYISAIMLKNRIKNKDEAFYFFACMNLLNSYIKKDYAEATYRKRYVFKEYVSLAITQIIENRIEGLEIYVDKTIIYIKVQGRQFSFHNVVRNKVIREFENSKSNVKQEWYGIRLQAICVSIYNEAKINLGIGTSVEDSVSIDRTKNISTCKNESLQVEKIKLERIPIDCSLPEQEFKLLCNGQAFL